MKISDLQRLQLQLLDADERNAKLELERVRLAREIIYGDLRDAAGLARGAGFRVLEDGEIVAKDAVPLAGELSD